MKPAPIVELSSRLTSVGLSLGSLLTMVMGTVVPGSAAIATESSRSATLTTPMEATQLADINIYFPYPAPTTEPQREVVVEFVGLGTEWATIYLNDRRLVNMGTHNRRQRFLLTEGAYRVQITGVTRFDTWATGYLDVGRSDANVIVLTFSPDGVVGVGGDPYAWIPDGRAR